MNKRSESSINKSIETRKKNKEEKLKKEEESRLKYLEERELLDLRKKPLPLPRFPLNVGDLVSSRNGGYSSGVVLEVLDNGKILRCEFTYEKEKLSNKGVACERRYVSSLDVLPVGVTKNTEFSNKTLGKRQMSFNNTFINSLFSYHYTFGINYSPEYQREFCWSDEDKEKLIESIFLGVEIGKFALIELPYSDDSIYSYEILDGKQRLKTLIDFYEDKFQYKGVYYSEMSIRDKNHFLNYNVALGIGKENFSLKDKLEYFLRLNIGGVVQSEEHLSSIRDKLKTIE